MKIETIIKVIIPKKRFNDALDALYERYKTRDIIQLFDFAMNLLQFSKKCKYNTISEKNGAFIFELHTHIRKYERMMYVFFYLLQTLSPFCASNTVCGTYIDGEIHHINLEDPLFDNKLCGIYCELGNRNEFVFNITYYKERNQKATCTKHAIVVWWLEKNDPLLSYSTIMKKCYKRKNSLNEIDDLTSDEGLLSSDDSDDSTYYPNEYEDDEDDEGLEDDEDDDEDNDEDDDEDDNEDNESKEDDNMSNISKVSEHDLSKIITSIHNPLNCGNSDVNTIFNNEPQQNIMSNIFNTLKNNSETVNREIVNSATENRGVKSSEMKSSECIHENTLYNSTHMHVAHIYDIMNTCINEHDASISISRSHLIQKLRNSLSPFQYSFNEREYNNIINKFINNIIIMNETCRKDLLFREFTECQMLIGGLKDISLKNDSLENLIRMQSEV